MNMLSVMNTLCMAILAVALTVTSAHGQDSSALPIVLDTLREIQSREPGSHGFLLDRLQFRMTWGSAGQPILKRGAVMPVDDASTLSSWAMNRGLALRFCEEACKNRRDHEWRVRVSTLDHVGPESAVVYADIYGSGADQSGYRIVYEISLKRVNGDWEVTKAKPVMVVDSVACDPREC